MVIGSFARPVHKGQVVVKLRIAMISKIVMIIINATVILFLLILMISRTPLVHL